MPRLLIPNSVALHNIRSFVEKNPHAFDNRSRDASIEFHPQWAYLEPVGLAMCAAWGAWARRSGYRVKVVNLGPKTNYAARMRLFEHLGVGYDHGFEEREEAGRFVPITNIRTSADVKAVIGDISALLHLEEDPETLSAVRYSVSELLRNVLEHSGSPDGAFVCAHRYTESRMRRVTVAVADCGLGIPAHLGRVYPEASSNARVALGLALSPGFTGAQAGLYGTPDNAGAGLFITRSIAKGSGGYFFVLSGDCAYRLRRARDEEEMTELFLDPFEEPRHDVYRFSRPWPGTVVSVEIQTDKIGDYEGFFQWIFNRVPRRATKRGRIRFS